MKHYIFETKENYLNMKQTWATYFNTEARNLKRNEYGNKEHKLTATHFALYAILRGKDPFNPLDNCSKKTLDDISYYVYHAQHSSFYNGKWAKFFGLTEKEERRMLAIANDIFCRHKDFKTVLNNFTEIEAA